MELSTSKTDDGVFNVQLLGTVTRDGMTVGRDPLTEQCGADIYKNRLLLDLSEAQHIDSTGVEWLLNCHQTCDQQGGLCVIHSPQQLVKDVLYMMRMELVLNIVRDKSQALTYSPETDNGQ